MSLIADALKRAQEQRTGDRRDEKARRLLATPGPVRVTSGVRRVERSVLPAVAVLVVAVAILGGAMVTAPRTDPGPAGERGNGRAEAVDAAAPRPGSVLAERAGTPAATPGVVDPSIGAAGEWTAGGTGAVRIGSPPPSDQAAWVLPAPVPGGAGPGGGPPAAATRAPAETPATATRAADPAPGPGSFRLTVEGGADATELFGLGLGAQQRGDYEAAALWYRRALALSPTDAQAHNNLGTVYRAVSMPDRAEASFRAAVAAEPGYAPAWSNLGMVLDGLGREEEAVEAFRSALRADPSNAGARINLANKYQGMGLVGEARRMLEGVLRDDPSLPEAHYAMGRALEAAGDPAGATRHYRQFLQLGRGGFGALEARVGERVRALEGGRP